MLTLALGIGATSAVLSLIQGVLLTPPPYRQPQQLVLVTTARTDGQKMDSPRGWPAQQWMEWQKEAKSFQGIAAYDWTFNFLIRNDGSQSMQGMCVTKDYLPVMGLKAVAGAGFRASRFWARASNGNSAGLRILAAHIQRRSTDHRQNRAHQPVGRAADGDRGDAAGSALSALAGGCEGAKLRRQCDGGFLDTGHRRTRNT